MGIEGIAPKATHSSRAFGNAAAAMLPPATTAVPTPNCPKTLSWGYGAVPQQCRAARRLRARSGTWGQGRGASLSPAGTGAHPSRLLSNVHLLPNLCTWLQQWVPPRSPAQPRPLRCPPKGRARCCCAGERGTMPLVLLGSAAVSEDDASRPPGEPQPTVPLLPAVLRRGREATALTWSWPGRRWRSGGSCLAAWLPWAIFWRWRPSRRCLHRPWP